MRQTQLNEELARMKKEYEQIPVPEEALIRMKAGIAQGNYEAGKRQETEKFHFAENGNPSRKSGRGLVRLMRTSGMTAAAALLAITVLVNTSPVVANAMEQIPVIGSIARVVTFRTYENKTNHFEANIKVPQIAQDSTAPAALEANKSIEDYAAQLIAMYENNLAETNGEEYYGLESTYEVVADTRQYLSIRINTSQTMASEVQYVKVFTIDKTTGQVVSLRQALSEDPARLQAVSDNIREQMEAQMQANPEIVYFLHMDLPENNFTGLTGEESYYRDPDGNLVVLFDEYEVAPGYMGVVEFTVPAQIAFPGEN